MKNNATHTVVIGSGVGGMAVAIRLAANGNAVTVYETQAGPGGKLSSFTCGPYHFDAGPSLFTAPQLLEELFEAAGYKLSDFLRYRAVDPICHYFFSDGSQFMAPAGEEAFATSAGEFFREKAGVIRNYLKRSGTRYHKVGRLFLEQSLHKPFMFPWREVPKALSAISPALLLRNMHKQNQVSFHSKRLTQLFDRYATYNGSNPYKAPALLTMIPHLEINEGTYFAEGGMISITNALYELATRLGVKFVFNTGVQRIIHHGAKVLGVVVNNENIPADLVVSNADAYFTYKNLLADNRRAARVLKQERSSSAVIFYWGIRKSFTQLGLHNIFFSDDYMKEFDAIFHQKRITDDPTIYINVSSKLASGHAPAGHENWFVMINAPANVGQNWDDLVQQLKRQVLNKLSAALGTDVASLIETEVIRDPRDIEHLTQSYMGSLYGTSSNSRLAAFLRHPNFSKQLQGLYFVGGSVHPGGGIPLCLHSAAITSRLINSRV